MDEFPAGVSIEIQCNMRGDVLNMELVYNNGIMWCKVENEEILKESIMLDGKPMDPGTIIDGFNINGRQRGFDIKSPIVFLGIIKDDDSKIILFDVYSNNMGRGWYIAFFYVDEDCILQANPYKGYGTDIYPLWKG